MLEAGIFLQDRYRIQKQIGQGGMGAVYVATDERFGSTVAIKETFFSDEGFGKAFEREARLLNNLRHPALPRVSDHFSDQHGQFLVMEYIAGQDLSEMMESEKKAFPVADVLNWAAQLLDALDFLHTQETPVVHRDIKPQNLKLTPRGQVILLDFGLAKGNPTDAQHQTAAKSVFGYSRNYASIEQIQGTGTDPRSDIYSLGATLYHLITGVPPADALTRAMQVLNGDKDPLKPANLLNPEVSKGVADVLLRAMALNSNQRPSSALAMQAMLAESEKTAFGGATEALPAVGLLSQETQISANEPGADTQPVANHTAASPLNFPEDETSLRGRNEEEFRNIQIPIGQSAQPTDVNYRSTDVNIKPVGSKRGLAIAATGFGGLLLAGTALGGLYVFTPSIFQRSAANSNISAPKNVVSEKQTTDQTDNTPAKNLAGGEILEVNANTTEPGNTKKDPAGKTEPKTLVENPKPAAETRDPGKEIPKSTKQPEKEPKVVVDSGDGTKIYDNGKVVSNDGTTIHPDGKVTQDRKVVVAPNPQMRPPPVPRTPVFTEEQLRNMTPQQRRRLRQVLERQRREGNIPPPQ